MHACTARGEMMPVRKSVVLVFTFVFAVVQASPVLAQDEASTSGQNQQPWKSRRHLVDLRHSSHVPDGTPSVQHPPTAR